jgi:hypothetical protein
MIDDGYDNYYSDSVEDFDDEEKRLSCKKCGDEFDVGAKGASRLKELCSKCHSVAIDYLLAGENESVHEPSSKDISTVVDEKGTDNSIIDLLHEVLSTLHHYNV